MANYNVDIGVKVRGEELKKFAEQLKQTKKQVDGVNKFLDTFRKQNIRVNESISNLNAQLAKAKSTFQSATIGTKQQVQAAKDLLQANQNLNKGLSQQQKLLDNLSGAGAKKTAADTKKLQDGLLKLERGSTRELENQFEFRQQGQEQLREKVNEINKQRQEENKLLKDNVAKTKQSVAAEIKKRFSIVASAKQRRRDLIISNRQVQTEIKINQILDARRRKQAAGGGQFGKRVGSTISSAAIGGAFPLLFGQTGAAAVGGGIGGLAGGAIGGQFGFALSIVGTAIGSAVDKNQKFNESLAVLNARLSVTSGSTQLVAKDIDDLAKRFRVTKEEAFGLLEGFRQFDDPTIRKSLVEVFGADSGAFQGLAGSNRSAKLANQIFEARKLIGDQQTTQLLQQNLINGAETVELALIRAKIKARQRDQLEQAKQISLFGRIGAGFRLKTADEVIENRIKKLEKTFAETEDQTIKDTIEGLKILREQLDLVNEAQGNFGQSGTLAFSAINDKVKDLQDEMKKLASPISLAIGLSDTMANSFESSFKGIIKGTMTVADAFRNMLNRIADHFLDTAARMLANQFQRGILGLFGNLFSGFGGGLASSAQLGAQATAMTGIPSGAALPAGSFNITGALANGGTAQRGKSYLVGERGAEIFTPGATGTVTPNHAMGATNIVVNVDASGSSVEGDEEQGRELGRMISVAIQSELIKQKRPGGMLA